jgi:hypothetical protein
VADSRSEFCQFPSQNRFPLSRVKCPNDWDRLRFTTDVGQRRSRRPQLPLDRSFAVVPTLSPICIEC